MAVSRTDGERGNVQFHKDLGLVSEVLRKDVVHNMNGDIGIGHVRYSTTGESVAENAQPLVLSYIKGSLALAHNGNLVNTEALKWGVDPDRRNFPYNYRLRGYRVPYRKRTCAFCHCRGSST